MQFFEFYLEVAIFFTMAHKSLRAEREKNSYPLFWEKVKGKNPAVCSIITLSERKGELLQVIYVIVSCVCISYVNTR